MKKHYNVVAAAVSQEGMFLCVQKGKTKYEYSSYKWEFPGGKIEPGETPQEALARELMEEMDYPVEVGKELVTVNHEYPDFTITMTAFLCKPSKDSFHLKEHIAFKWLETDKLPELDWVAADKGIVKAIVSST